MKRSHKKLSQILGQQELKELFQFPIGGLPRFSALRFSTRISLTISRTRGSRILLCMISCLTCWLTCATTTRAASPREFASSSPFQTSSPLTSTAPSKVQVLASLKALQGHQTQQLEATTQSIQRVLLETRSITLQKGNDSLASESVLTNLPERLGDIQRHRDELRLRSDFLNQLAVQLENKWNAQSLNQFLEQILFEMALNELTNPSNHEASSDPLRRRVWLFYTYLSIAIREIPDPREDTLAFLSGYMEFSSIQSPKSPLEFLDSRNYTNGSISQAAQPVQRDQLGALVEKRLQALGAANKVATEKSKTKTGPIEKGTQSSSTSNDRDTERADIELRLRAEPTPSPSIQTIPGYE